MSLAREFDVIVFGATGFTGTLVAKYLLKHSDSFRWAVAGRSMTKLRSLASQIDLPSNVALIEADSGDSGSLKSMVRRTKVVLTTVGPYALYGTRLVEACVDASTHCVDLTGETPWIRKSIDAFDARARESNAFIVHCCGFDSVPADMGTFLLAKEVDQRYNGKRKLARVHAICTVNGSASGGTIASMVNLLDTSTRAELRQMRHAYSLNSNDEWRTRKPTADERDQMFVARHDGQWTLPFIMAAVNTRIVRRSAELRRYGDAFTYNESMAARGPISAFLLWILMAFGMLLLSIRFTRALLVRYVLPSPGQGPSEAKRAASFFRYNLTGTLDDGSATLRARVSGGDPGYTVTASLISEAALTLALDGDSLDTTLPGGVTTPASALGNAYLERLNRCPDVQFELVDDDE